MKQIAWRDLVHDIIEINETTQGAETGCGMILRATPDKMTDAPTNCFQCISGEFEFQRELGALESLKNNIGLADVYNERLRKHLTPKGGGD